jgi:hypothetical protein
VPDISAGSLTFTLPPTDGDNTNLLQTNGSGVLTWVASPSTSPGGNDTEVQYNNGGSFGGDATFNFNDTTKVLDVDGLTITGTIATGLDMSGGTFATANINLAANPIIQAAGTTIAVFDNTNKNMFFGELAGDNSPGEANVFIGYEAGRYNETTAALDGDKNVYIGYQVGKGPAGNKNLAYLNVGIGYQCLFNSEDGSGNMAIGDRCLYNCVDGESNTGIGQQALYNNVTGNYNVGLGYQAGRGITGTHSIAVGYNSLLGATGSQNTAIGGRAGSGLGTGSGNVFIGYYSCGHTANISNSIFIGLRSGHNHTLSNRLIIWNQSVATEAIESANSIIYGVMASAAKDQSLTINASTFAVNGGADTDVTMNFTGTTNSGVYKWMEDEDYFEFSDDILVASAEKVLLRDTAIGIYSQADTYMDLFADGGVRIGDSSAGAPTNYMEIESDGDVNFHGGAGLVFGSFYGNNIAFVTAGGTGTYSVVSDADIAAGQTHNTTFQNNQELDIGTYAGMYQVTWSMSVKGTGAGKHIVGAIGVDVGGVAGDVAQNPGRNHAITLGASEMCLAGTAILDLSADDEVSLMVTNETDNTNVTVEHVNLTITQIGGT